MALYKVTLFQEQAGQQIINTWNYRSESTPATVSGSFGLAAAMGFVDGFGPGATSIFEGLKATLSTALLFTEVQVANLYSPTDFYTQPFVGGDAGENAGTAMTPFVSFGFYTSRVRTDIRRGFKRFAGVNEENVSANGTVAGGVLAGLQAIADRMSATLEYDDEGNTLSYNPVILGLESYTTPSGKTAYRPYATEAEQLMHLAQGFAYTPYNEVRSQVSRQFGRGR